jgi:hypothetical protein
MNQLLPDGRVARLERAVPANHHAQRAAKFRPRRQGMMDAYRSGRPRTARGAPMVEIEHQRVDTISDGEGVLANIPRALGFLFTRLFTRDDGGALLHAEHRAGEAEVVWYVRPRGDGVDGADAPVATLPATSFSSMISRVAIAFDVNYITGGAGRGTILFEGRRFDCTVFLSRNRATGYWIRLYAVPGVRQTPRP